MSTAQVIYQQKEGVGTIVEIRTVELPIPLALPAGREKVAAVKRQKYRRTRMDPSNSTSLEFCPLAD